MHGHFVGSILEGATGAKHWITRLGAYEPASGKAYRKILSKYNGFYEKLCEYVKELSPFGCRIPLTLMQNYGFVPASQGLNLSPWATMVLERFGLPLFFSNEDGNAVFLDDFSTDGFDDEQIKKFLSGTLILSVGAAEKLCKRGFSEYIGVSVQEWTGAVISGELTGDIPTGAQYERKQLVPCSENVEWLSKVYHINKDNEKEILFPGVTRFDNSLGGEVITFCGTPDMPFKYFTAFSLLNETRKKQFIEILTRRGHLPLYYPEDGEVYLRAGYLKDGSIMAAFFNIGFDILEDIPIVSAKPVTKVERLNPDGTRSQVPFTVEDGVIRVQTELKTLLPEVLFIS